MQMFLKIQLSIKDFPRLIDMTPPIFDFERWFKDTWGPGCKEGGRIPGYTLYYEEMRALKKAAGWEVLETGAVEFNGGHGFIPPVTAIPYLSKYSGGDWTLEERDELLTRLTEWVNDRARVHGRTQDDIRKAVADLCKF